MDYFKTVKESFYIWWKNKYLWILGIIAVIFGGNTSSSSNMFQNNFKQTDVFKDSPEIGPIIILIAVALACIGLIVMVIGIYLKSRSDASLISSIPLIEKKTSLGFRKAWALSTGKWIKLFLLNLFISVPILVLIFLALGIILVVYLTSSQMEPDVLLLTIGFVGVPLICLIAIYSLITRVIYTFASRISILKDVSTWESIKKGWTFLNKNFSNILVFWLIDLVIGVVTGPVVAIASLAIFTPVIILVFSLFIVNIWFGILVGAVLAIVIGALLSLLSGPIYTFSEIYWTKVYLTLNKENA
jgi:hypothetical protein